MSSIESSSAQNVSPSSTKSSELKDLHTQCHPKNANDAHLVVLPPFNDVVQKLAPENGKLEFGYWESDENPCWSLIEVGNGQKWQLSCLSKQCTAELHELRNQSLNDVNDIVAKKNS